MSEIHPYGNFVPKNAGYLILGSFPGRPDDGNDWFYGSRRNQFWPILEKVYNRKLDTKIKKQKLLKNLKIATTDIIFSCDRKKGTNSDTNLINISYNTKAIENILTKNKIEKIFFTSRFVENSFKKQFKDFPEIHTEIEIYPLPSPSPRYAKMSLSDKIMQYKKLLPSC